MRFFSFSRTDIINREPSFRLLTTETGPSGTARTCFVYFAHLIKIILTLLFSNYIIVAMIDKTQTVAELMMYFYRVVNKVNELEKMPYDFGVGEKLYPSEIHTIQAIGHNSGINVTSLAQKLGITKGGVSQMISKLKKRGFINKVRSMDNDKEVLLILTGKGQKAFNGHEKFHYDMYMDFINYMNDISSEQIDMFKAVLGKVDFYVDQYRIK